MSNILNSQQLIYSMTNHKLGNSGIICVGYTTNIIATLHVQHTKDFCYDYMRLFCAKHLKIPYVHNDTELVINEKLQTIDLYRRKIPYKVDNTLDFTKMDLIATLRLSTVPNDAQYSQYLQESYDELTSGN